MISLGVQEVYDGYKQQKRKQMIEASASVCLLLATVSRLSAYESIPRWAKVTELFQALKTLLQAIPGA